MKIKTRATAVIDGKSTVRYNFFEEKGYLYVDADKLSPKLDNQRPNGVHEAIQDENLDRIIVYCYG